MDTGRVHAVIVGHENHGSLSFFDFGFRLRQVLPARDGASVRCRAHGAFGGPQGPDDIRPFLENVLRARRVPPARIEAVAHHYELFGGVSPITEITERQAHGLEPAARPRPAAAGLRRHAQLAADLADTLRAMARPAAPALRLIAAAHRSYSSCEQYKQNVWQAQEELACRRGHAADVIYAADWHQHPGFVEAAPAHHASPRDAPRRALRARRARSSSRRTRSRSTMAAVDRYREQFRESATAVASRQRGRDDWALVYQSRSGRPEDPWLEPDINDYLRERARAACGGDRAARLHRRSHRGALRPRRRSARDRRAWGSRWRARRGQRPSAFSRRARRRGGQRRCYRRGLPLPLLPATAPARREPPPPVRSAAASGERLAGDGLLGAVLSNAPMRSPAIRPAPGFRSGGVPSCRPACRPS